MEFPDAGRYGRGRLERGREPYERDGVTVIAAARVAGGGDGMDQNQGQQGEVTGQPALAPVADEATARLRTALAALSD
ncbi:hypothetical protein GCM10029964_056660 [Kibdelosporangium lantanae]